jgi:PPP family 3-phenylpropionic acid transporter
LYSKGFTVSDIGILLAMPMATKIIAPNIWGWLSDYTGKRLGVIRVGAFLSCIFFLGIFFDQKFWSIALVMIGYSFFWNAILPQHEVITLSYLEKSPETYGRIRLWGSIGFIISVLGGGLWFDFNDIETLPIVGLLLLIGIFIASIFLPKPFLHKSDVRNSKAFIFFATRPIVIVFLLVGLLVQLSHGVYYSFFSIYLESYGYNRGEIGAIWSIGVIAEVFIFLLMYRILIYFGVRKIILLCLILGVIRWLIIGYHIENLVLLVIAQIFHAFTFGAFHAACIECVRRLFDRNYQGKAQALYSSCCYGAGGAIGSYTGGFAWEVAPIFAFNYSAISSLAAFFLALFWLKDEKLSINNRM